MRGGAAAVASGRRLESDCRIGRSVSGAARSSARWACEPPSEDDRARRADKHAWDFTAETGEQLTIIEGLREDYLRHIDRLRAEIEAFMNEDAIWKRAPGITNPAGNLCLHLAGNLEHFIGAQLGGSDYVRDRPAEFATPRVSRSELLRRVESAREQVDRTFVGLAESDLTREVPTAIADETQPLGRWLPWILCHLNYHLGQINYCRRLLDH